MLNNRKKYHKNSSVRGCLTSLLVYVLQGDLKDLPDTEPSQLLSLRVGMGSRWNVIIPNL